MGHISNRMIGALLAAGLAMSSITWAAKPVDTCWQAPEHEAYRLRALQSLLMVATLKCKVMGDAAITDKYNLFVTATQPHMQSSASILLARFKRLGGGPAMKLMDQMSTDLANQFSAAPMGINACSKAGDVAQMAANISAAELTALAGSLVPAPETLIPCKTE